jgi:acetyl-CoA carboxylase carboxyl transferase subunit alpha
LKRLGLVDEIIPEPAGGAQNDYGLAADAAAAALRRHLGELERVSVDRLVEARYARYRQIGAS